MARLAREKADADGGSRVRTPTPRERDRLKETIARQGDVGSRLARLEAEWLELAEAISGSTRRGKARAASLTAPRAGP